MHRIHALGISHNDEGILCILPQGGGKTTLGLSLLKKYDDVKLLSDDTVLISRDGMLIPFPVRIGLCEEDKIDVPNEYRGTLIRRKYGKKMLFDRETEQQQVRCLMNP